MYFFTFLFIPSPICDNTLIYEGHMRVLKGQGKKILSKLLLWRWSQVRGEMTQVASALKTGRENRIPGGKLKGKQPRVPWID